jgi:hypothetical protein
MQKHKQYNPANYPKVSQQVLGFSAVVLQTLYYRIAHSNRNMPRKDGFQKQDNESSHLDSSTG